MRRGCGSWASDPWLEVLRALRRVRAGRRVWIVIGESVRVL
jgi:hypothetical protein